MITRKDVAKRAGVSQSIVSYVTNNSNYVSEEKKELVLKAIEELGYRPNYFARGLKTKKTNHIVLVSSDIRNEFFGDMAYAVEEYAYKKGYYVSLCNGRNNDEYIERLINYQVEGAFILTSKFKAEQLNRLSGKGVITILFNNREYSGLDKNITLVRPDFYNGAKKATDYLIENGHKSIAFFSDEPITGMEDNNFRLQGYISSLKEHNLKVNADIIDFIGTGRTNLVERVKAIMSAKQTPSGIVAWNDALALRILGILKQMGIRVPDDISVTGMDNISLAQYSDPPLTTIDYSRTELAQVAVDCIIKKTSGENVENVLINTCLIVRGSVKDIR